MVHYHTINIAENYDRFFKDIDDYSSFLNFYGMNRNNKDLFGIDVTDSKNLQILVNRYDRMMSILSYGPKTDMRITNAIQDITKRYAQIYEKMVKKNPVMSKDVFFTKRTWYTFFKSLFSFGLCAFLYILMFLLVMVLALKITLYIAVNNVNVV
ncbi:hypothetical protein SLOPH_479 [Spraguea lophii 42_110]|uniref:Uncharacterized protein n=1 Tax=Spraguea lophii (strain 42_110) TaxID=1358809 RepID=S7WDR0_SPRLO|nr:hypothetical protein SLOPH_479 [Spraguea lophii 42_110]